MKKQTQFLIVGQGLAGSLLAHEFHKRGMDFLLIAEPELSQSSLISAGLWNPVVFKRMTESWMATEIIPHMHGFYTESENLLKEKFLKKRKMLKFFTEQQEADLWMKKYHLGLSAFIEGEIYAPDDLKISGIEKPAAGYAFIHESGNVDTRKFVESTRKWLTLQTKFIEEKFDHALIENRKGEFQYKGINAEQIIFCEGFLNSENPFFGYIPFKPAKGEVITFECPELKTEHILNKGIFILPLEGGLFKCGATYEWNDLHQHVTDKGQAELKSKLEKLLKLPYQITQRFAGIRPSVIDRRPVLGEHPEKKGMWIFNGLGTKAVMLGPYFANELCNFITGNGQLNPEVNIQRFSKKIS